MNIDTLAFIQREFRPAALDNPLVTPYMFFVMEDVDDCAFHYRLQMIAPDGSPYEGHNFEVRIFFPPDYPMNPPKFAFHFDGDLFHPNFTKIGAIRLDILHENWSHAIRVVEILAPILGLMCVPNPDDPYPDCEGVALIYRNNPQRFAKYARKIMGLNALS